MRATIFAGLLLLFFGGCAQSERAIYINNQSICQEPLATLELGSIEITNNAKSINITRDELAKELLLAIKESGCFTIASGGFRLDVSSTLDQSKEVRDERFYKVEKHQDMTLDLRATAINGGGSKVVASAKSSLSIDTKRYLGVERGTNEADDTATLLRSATKKFSIALRDGFNKLGR